MQEAEDEKYREKVMMKMECDALDAEYVVDSTKYLGAIAIEDYEGGVIEKRDSNKRRADPVL